MLFDHISFKKIIFLAITAAATFGCDDDDDSSSADAGTAGTAGQPSGGEGGAAGEAGQGSGGEGGAAGEAGQGGGGEGGAAGEAGQGGGGEGGAAGEAGQGGMDVEICYYSSDCVKAAECEKGICSNGFCTYEREPECCIDSSECEASEDECFINTCSNNRCSLMPVDSCALQCSTENPCESKTCFDVTCNNGACDYTAQPGCCSDDVACAEGYCKDNVCVQCLEDSHCVGNDNGNTCSNHVCVNVVGKSLIISEYLEGTSNNKAVEIYNATDEDVSMGNCTLDQYLDGCDRPGCTTGEYLSLPLSNIMLEKGTTHVICHPEIEISYFCNQYTTSFEESTPAHPTFKFNGAGGDALQLVCNGVVIDTFGVLGGTENIGKDVTMRRQCYVDSGSVTFVPDEWTTEAADTFTGIGRRERDCDGPTRCLDGQYDNNGTCAMCTPHSNTNCEEVTCTTAEDSVCVKCKEDYRLSEGNCYARLTCSQSNQYYDQETESCKQCAHVTGCDNMNVVCTNAEDAHCTQCIDGYFFEGTRCRMCSQIDNCAEERCTERNASTCIQCDTDYISLDNGLTCEQQRHCDYTDEYYDAATNACVACPEVANCKIVECSNASDSHCYECNVGFALNSNGGCEAAPTK